MAMISSTNSLLHGVVTASTVPWDHLTDNTAWSLTGDHGNTVNWGWRAEQATIQANPMYYYRNSTDGVFYVYPEAPPAKKKLLSFNDMLKERVK